MAERAFELPRKLLVEMMSYIPEQELREMFREANQLHRKQGRQTSRLKLVDPSKLDPLVGLAKVGGDALEDTERYYE